MKYLLNTAVLVLMLATPATAAEIIFYTGQSGYTGAFSGAGSVYNQTKSGTINCPTGGCVNDNIQNTLSFAAQPSGQSFHRRYRYRVRPTRPISDPPQCVG